VCRNVPTSGFLDIPPGWVAACVDERASSADAGVSAPPFAGVCGNAEWDNVEQCDDGNQRSGDGCSEFCTLEAGFHCPRRAGGCFPNVGDAHCSPSACQLGALCVDTIDVPHPISGTIGTSCACPASALPECPPLVALQFPLPSWAAACGGLGISGDGATVVGVCSDSDRLSLGQSARGQAMRWTIARGAEALPTQGSSEALAVSADGAVIVGRDALGPFIWTADEVLHPGTDADADLGAARSISADGRVVVGGSTRAWVWTAEAGVRELPASTDGSEAGATRVSADGSRIIGFEVTAAGARLPLLWSLDGEVQELPPPAPPDDRIELIAVDASGSLIIGNYGAPGSSVRGIWSWTTSTGASIGQNGDSASALSADGRLLVGYRLGASTFRLDRGAAFDYLLPHTPNVHVIDFGATAVSADASTVAGSASLEQRLDSRSRAAMTWLP
jgi:cysteine-rich repeat protein